jgi:transcriptional regulator with XRE-family HTH domain
LRSDRVQQTDSTKIGADHTVHETGSTPQLDNNTELHQRWISNVETGKRNPSYGSLRRLAAGLDLTASELLARAEQIEARGIETVNAGAR